jgi:hypothetical protein
MCIRAAISSRTRRKTPRRSAADPVASAGSSNVHCRRCRTPGKTGHLSFLEALPQERTDRLRLSAKTIPNSTSPPSIVSDGGAFTRSPMGMSAERCDCGKPERQDPGEGWARCAAVRHLRQQDGRRALHSSVRDHPYRHEAADLRERPAKDACQQDWDTDDEPDITSCEQCQTRQRPAIDAGRIREDAGERGLLLCLPNTPPSRWRSCGC